MTLLTVPQSSRLKRRVLGVLPLRTLAGPCDAPANSIEGHDNRLALSVRIAGRIQPELKSLVRSRAIYTA